MDLIDKKILCELDLNCRTPLSKIAKKLRIGRNVLDYRIKKLEKEKLITSYICSISLSKFGYKSYKIYCKMHSLSQIKEKELIEFLKNQSSVIHLIKTEGSFDYAFVVGYKNILDLDLFLTNFRTKFNNLLQDYFVSIIVYSKIFKLQKLLLGEKQEILKFDRYGNEQKEIALDEKDKKILLVLSKEANISLIDLSKKTGLSLDIVKYRLKFLTQDVVSSYRAIIDMNKLDYFHYVLMLKIRNASNSEEQELISSISSKKNVMYFTKRIGHFDYEINFAIKDINDLNLFISEIKSQFGSIIDSYELILNSKILKLNYLTFEK